MQQPFYFNPYDQQERSEAEQKFLHDLKRKKQESEILKLGLILGLGITGVIIMNVIVSSYLLVGDNYDLYFGDVVFYSCFNIIGSSLLSVALPFGILALIMRKKFITPIIPTEKIGAGKTFAWVSVGMLACMASNIVVNVINSVAELFDYKLEVPESPPIESIFGCVIVFVGTAIMPALCEEFAMRCCAMGIARKHGKAFSVIAISVLFGLIHGNVVQFIFATLIGLIMGYVTVKTDSVIPAVLIHGCNNALSAIYDIVEYLFNTETSDTVSSILCIGWVIVGIIALAKLISQSDLLIKKQPKSEDDVLPLGMKFVYLLPGLTIPIIYFIASIILSIQSS